MANLLDNAVVLEASQGLVVFRDLSTDVDVLYFYWYPGNPNGILIAPVGSIVSGLSGAYINTDGASAWSALTGGGGGSSSSEAPPEFYVDPNLPSGSVPSNRWYTTIDAAVAAAEADPNAANGYTIRVQGSANGALDWSGAGHTGTRPITLTSFSTGVAFDALGVAINVGAQIRFAAGSTFGAGTASVTFSNVTITPPAVAGTYSFSGRVYVRGGAMSGNWTGSAILAAPMISIDDTTSLMWAFSGVIQATRSYFYFGGAPSTWLYLGSGDNFLSACDVFWDAGVSNNSTTLVTSIAANNLDLYMTQFFLDSTSGLNYVYNFTGGAATLTPAGDTPIVSSSINGTTFNIGTWTKYIGVRWVGPRGRTVSGSATVDALTDQVLRVNNAAASITLSLPAATAVTAGVPYTFEVLSSVETYDVVLVAAGSDTFEGLSVGQSYSSARYGAGNCTLTLYCDGLSKWYVVNSAEPFPIDSADLVHWVEADYGVIAPAGLVDRVIDRSGHVGHDYVKVTDPSRPTFGTSNGLPAIIAAPGELLSSEVASTLFEPGADGLTIYAVCSSPYGPIGDYGGVICGGYDNLSWFLLADWVGAGSPADSGAMVTSNGTGLPGATFAPMGGDPGNGAIQLLVGRVQDPRGAGRMMYGQRSVVYTDGVVPLVMAAAAATKIWLGTYSGAYWAGAGAVLHAQLIYRRHVEPGSQTDIRARAYLSKWMNGITGGGSRTVTSTTLQPTYDGVLTVNNLGGVSVVLPDARTAPPGKLFPIKATVDIAAGPINDVTLTCAASAIEGIAAPASYSFFTNGGMTGKAAFSVYSDGSAWWVV